MQLSLMRLVTPFKTASQKITFIMKIDQNMTQVCFSFYKITLRGIMRFVHVFFFFYKRSSIEPLAHDY